MGSRIFDKAENPKDGASLAAPRREARGTRRRIRRHIHRNERIKYLITSSGMLTQSQMEDLFKGKLEDIYELRTRALDEKLTENQFARILIHLAQRRGFKSNRKNEKKNSDDGKLLSAVSENAVLMKNNGYRTVGEMFYKNNKFSECKRNKAEDYSNTVSREMVIEEIEAVFDAQKKYGNLYAADEIRDKYIEIVLSQRSFEDGPGGSSKYGGNQIEKMIGRCTFFPEEKRAAKATYSFQIFNLWQKINNITIYNGNVLRILNDFERKQLFDLCHNTASVTYSKIRKELSIPEEFLFKGLDYGEKAHDEVEKKTKFEFLKPYHEIRKALNAVSKDAINYLTKEQLDIIGYVFTVYKTDDKIIKELKNAEIDSVYIDALNNITAFSGFGHISVKACKLIIPNLEEGLKYDKACEKAGIDFKMHNNNEKLRYLPAVAPELDDITNGVVRRAVSQTIKVINAIIREQGESPVYINIELARELSKNRAERDALDKSMKENQAKNEKIAERMKTELGVSSPTGMDILKFKLWQEQDGVCLYSGQRIPVEKLFDVGFVDIDHIVPYSISFDDSFNNKVLVLSSENRQKGNRLPLEYLSGEKREKFIVYVNANVKNSKKRLKLLKEQITDDDIKGFKERNLNDTKYLSSLLYNYINDYLAFAPFSDSKKRHVYAVNGAVTSYLRKRWGISKIRADGDLHHAVDATVIACVTGGLISRVTKYSNDKEIEYSFSEEGSIAVNRHTGEVKDMFPQPYPYFRKELEARIMTEASEAIRSLRLLTYTPREIENLKQPLVSRMSNHKVTGAAHLDTIRSGKVEGYTITKTSLDKLKLDKNGEIQNYCPDARESDRLLYDALKERLTMFNGDGKKAFPEDYIFRKPKADGTEGPVVKKVKIQEKSSLNVPVRDGNGVADNGSMVRVDVYYIDGEGYYLVPVYVADTVKKELPNKAVVAHKPYSEWKEMSDENFVFSLFNNDLIKVTAKKPYELTVKQAESTLPKKLSGNGMMLYYKKCGISSGTITVENHDGSYELPSMGVKSLLSIEKYVPDVLGNYYKINKEKRMRFK